jgi:hypothetical protein
MGFGLRQAIQREGKWFCSQEGGIRKNFDYSVLLARSLAYPGAGY